MTPALAVKFKRSAASRLISLVATAALTAPLVLIEPTPIQPPTNQESASAHRPG